MYIPFVDLKLQYQNIKSEIDNALNQVLSDTAFIGGKHVNEFEKKFENIYGVKHCISVANGTDSLYIIMKMLGIGIGDEVITSAYSWISSSETISQTGAKPVFVDIDEYFTIDVDLIESHINAKTKAILPVHIHGQVCQMDKILSIAKKHNLYVIEDCAQAHFSEFNKYKTGLMGVAGSFSFYPGKNLGAYGDAGCIITNNDDLALKCRMYARHGALRKHQHLIEGINSRLDGIQAAILNVKLKNIIEWTNGRIKNSFLYKKYLSHIKEIELPIVRNNTVHTFHLYVIKTEKRDELMDFLLNNQIETSVHYPISLPNMIAYEYLKLNKDNFPNAIKNESRILSLPMYPELTEDQIKYIASKISTFFGYEN
ncbi:MAG: DegT/DnrJ/EryC1/StrS family aminotransferase [Chitinophagaceae bacterium]|nr:DegT/DnrJ/EryC1/StrS family aminotransferase [Chitinophagaceae bacterium]